MLTDVRPEGLDLPVAPVLPGLVAALRSHGRAVLVAPPGTGKTTLAPLALAGALGPGARVVVTEPRRVAVRAAARRMAALLGEEVGERVGYAVRGDRRTSNRTRVEVVTTGVLLRRLQRDAELPGVGALLLDEVHERALDADLAMALAVDVRTVLRPDLWLVAASATPDVDLLTTSLAGGADAARPGAPAEPGAAAVPQGPDVPVVTATAPVHPLDVVHAPPPSGLDPPVGLRVDPRLLDHVAAVVRRALVERSGDVLVVLPGAGEITGVAGLLAARAVQGEPVDVLALHGRMSPADQDAALRPGPRRRVVCASAVAESSLTVPGVRVVVDAGLARVPRVDHARGLGSLDTVRVSRASAVQRAGRAAREGPGTVYRCWSRAEDARLPPRARAEVAVADLTGFVLALACWGTPGGAGLALPEPPPAGAVAAAEQVLRPLGLLDDRGHATARGRAVADLGVDPRLGRALLDGAADVGPRTAAEVVALLSEEGLVGGAHGDDLVAAWRALRRGDDRGRSVRWRDEVRRLRGALRDVRSRDDPNGDHAHGDGPGDHDDRRAGEERAAAHVVALAYPGRVARRRGATTAPAAGDSTSSGGGEYLMAGGTAARLGRGSVWTGADWLAVAVADRGVGHVDATVRVAAPLDEAGAREAAAGLLAVDEEVTWSGGDVVARRVERLGALVLSQRRLADPPRPLVQDALLEGLRRDGLGLLGPGEAAERLRQRLAAARAALGDPWPDVSPQALVASAPTWLGPELVRARRRSDLARTDVVSALRRLLPWPQAGRLDQLVPERLPLPSGRVVRLDYTDPAAPVLAVRLQEVLGWEGGPRVLDGRVPVVVHLLSPAGRPLAVTADLASFWRGAYADVRAQMRGRYPKHAWPPDPLAPPRS